MSHEPVLSQRHRCRNAPPRVPQYSLRISAHVGPSINGFSFQQISCISHIVVALGFAIPVRQSEDHEQKQRHGQPVACRRRCASLHPSTQTQNTNPSLENIRLWALFFLFVLSGLYSNTALLLLETHATASTKTVLGRMVWRQKIHCLVQIATTSHRDDTASGEHLYLTGHTWYGFGSR